MYVYSVLLIAVYGASEAFDPSNPSSECKLADMTTSRSGPGGTDGTVCGGWYKTPPTCETFHEGQWGLSHNMTQERGNTNMWKTPSGKLMVLGGQTSGGSLHTSEVLQYDGSTLPGFDLMDSHNSYYSNCAVDLCSSVVFLGGTNYQYDEDGAVTELPNLVTRRNGVGCSYYVDANLNKVSETNTRKLFYIYKGVVGDWWLERIPCVLN